MYLFSSSRTSSGEQVRWVWRLTNTLRTVLIEWSVIVLVNDFLRIYILPVSANLSFSNSRIRQRLKDKTSIGKSSSTKYNIDFILQFLQVRARREVASSFFCLEVLSSIGWKIIRGKQAAIGSRYSSEEYLKNVRSVYILLQSFPEPYRNLLDLTIDIVWQNFRSDIMSVRIFGSQVHLHLHPLWYCQLNASSRDPPPILLSAFRPYPHYFLPSFRGHDNFPQWWSCGYLFVHSEGNGWITSRRSETAAHTVIDVDWRRYYLLIWRWRAAIWLPVIVIRE